MGRMNDRVAAIVQWLVQRQEEIGSTNGENVSIQIDCSGPLVKPRLTKFDSIRVGA